MAADQLGHLRHALGAELVLALLFLEGGRDLLGGEAPCGVLDEPLLFGQFEVHVIRS